jgi:hypothetical protein
LVPGRPDHASTQELNEERRIPIVIPDGDSLTVHFFSRVFSLKANSAESELLELRDHRAAESKKEAELQQILIDGNDFIGRGQYLKRAVREARGGLGVNYGSTGTALLPISREDVELVALLGVLIRCEHQLFAVRREFWKCGEPAEVRDLLQAAAIWV